MAQIKIENNLKEFDQTMQEYITWNKRAMPDIINQKLYFIALRAMQLTKTGDKTKIKAELQAPAARLKRKSNASLAEILTLIDLKKRGKMPKRSKTFQKNFPALVQKFINKRTSRTQFLRSGWLPAIKKLDYWNRKGSTESISFSRKFAPKKPPGIKQYGRDKGDVKPAPITAYGQNCRGTIFNFVATEGKQRTPTASIILQAGLDVAIKEEIKSMRTYMQRKWDEKHRKLASAGFMRLG